MFHEAFAGIQWRASRSFWVRSRLASVIAERNVMIDGAIGEFDSSLSLNTTDDQIFD
jgi:hypothetical protein